MKKLLITLVVFAIISLVGIVASVVYYDEAYITSVLTYHDSNVFTSYTSGQIDRDVTIRGKLIATEDNLATIKLRINTFNRMNTTHLQFRIRKEGAPSWLATNVYVTDRFPDGLLYPFGFPPIPDSKNKVYEFELTSHDGEDGNAIGIHNGYHAVASLYSFQKTILVHNKVLFRTFIYEKMRSVLTDPYSYIYFLMFLLPAFAVLTKGLIRDGKRLTVCAAVFCILLFVIYTYLPVAMNSNTILFVAVSGIFLNYLWGVPASFSYVFALLWLFQIPVALLTENILVADRSAMLVFFLILTGVIMSVNELKKK